MGKYNIPLDLTDATSCGQILKRIPEGSCVLEFGCAEGRMTRYMSEVLHCKVYIIEIDESAYLNAMKYAENGICCDANSMKWKELITDILFDRIIFADVLEHLINPGKVLKEAASVLKDDGQILVSIPNIGHADIICSLLCNRFKYMETGLLDNTHIRFWGRKDFVDFVEDEGLCVVEEDAVYPLCNTTEQAVLSSALQDGIRFQVAKFPYTEVYQFIFVLSKRAWVSLNNIIPVSNIDINNTTLGKYLAKVYFDTGQGFNEQQTSGFYVKPGEPFSHNLKLPSGTKAIRFDPSEESGCVVWNLEIKQGLKQLDFVIPNGFKLGDFLVFETNDSQIYLQGLTEGFPWIEIKAIVFAINNAEWMPLCEQIKIALAKNATEYAVVTKASEDRTDKSLYTSSAINGRKSLSALSITLKGAIRHMKEKTHELLEQMITLNEDNSKLIDLLKYVQSENEKLEYKVDWLQGAYDAHKTEALKLKNDLESALKEKTDQLNGSWAELDLRRNQVNEYRQEYEMIMNSRSWRITRPFRLFTAFLKRTVFFKPIMKAKKALLIWRNQGFREMIKEVKFHFKKQKVGQELVQLQENLARKPFVPYAAEYQENMDFSGRQIDVKVLAFYLPQFHTFPENDAWWGNGFTEWTNVKKSLPRFDGHYQPRVPHEDIGYYCLENIEVLRQQAKLAKQHGIYGFCFYYYWFSGKRLMEKPVDMLLQHPEIDLPFCLCWANENWTRRWDGQEQDVLIKQDYTDEDDEQFIIDMKKYLVDPRYIRVNGHPLIILYNPGAMPNCRKSILKWREVARTIGIGDLEIWICQTWGRTATYLNIDDCVDAEVEFPPHSLGGDWMEIKNIKRTGKDTIIYDYNIAVNYIINEWKNGSHAKLPKHYTCMMAWDNAARRKDGWHGFYRFSLSDLYRWVSEAVRQSRINLPEEERYLFINAWNEWGEGTYLEPDEKYGYANINTVSKAIYDLPIDTVLKTRVINECSRAVEQVEFDKNEKTRIAVQAHIYYTQLIGELLGKLNNIPFAFDLYVTTDTEVKKRIIISAFQEQCKCKRVEVLIVPNRGRDVAPFLIQMAPIIHMYDYIGHFHTKRTVTATYGDAWRKYLFKHLLGSEKYIKRLFAIFEEDEQIGIIIPEVFKEVREGTKWTGEHKGIEQLLSRIGYKVSLPDELVFPAGNMFWARTKAVAPLFELGLQQNDFPVEEGQRYATIAHQIERAWAYVAEFSGYGYCAVLNNCHPDN